MVLCLNGKSITANGSFDAITVPKGVTFTLTVEKDPEQQRVGRTFTFHTDDPSMKKTAQIFNGKTCTVLEQVDPKLHYEPLSIGEMMWRVRFSDGPILDVYDHAPAHPTQEGPDRSDPGRGREEGAEHTGVGREPKREMRQPQTHLPKGF